MMSTIVTDEKSFTFNKRKRSHKILRSPLVFNQSKFLLKPIGILSNEREKAFAPELQYFTEMFQNLQL